MKKNYFLIAMVLTAFAVNAQTPISVAIENGDFSLPDDSTKYTTVNDIVAWKSDDLVDNNNGREPNYVCYMKNIGGSIYNVLAEVIPATETTYTLTFDHGTTYNPEAGTEIDFVVTFSSLASGADSTSRVAIESITIIVDTDPDSVEVIIPAGAAYAGDNLVIEIDCNTPSETNDNTWITVDNFELTKIEAVTKVQNTSLANKTMVFPNPASEYLNIETKLNEVSAYKLTDISGKEMLKGYVNKNDRIDVSSLNSGIYLLNIHNSLGSEVIKTVIK
jgi:hypothetical protein